MLRGYLKLQGEICEWEEHVTRMDAERLLKITRGNMLSARSLQNLRKEDGAT
jgi:hypothetical protein